MTAILRLGLAVIVFCLSLLAVFHPPTYNGWKAAIGVIELGHYLALNSLLTWLPGWHRTRVGKVAATLGVLAFVLSISPLLRALPVATGLPDRLASAFGPSQPRSLPGATPLSKPLAFTTLFRKPASPRAPTSTRHVPSTSAP